MQQKVLSIALALCLCMSAAPTAHAWEAPSPQENVLTEGYTTEPIPYEDVKIPTQREAYDAMIAQQETYPEGMEWTNDNTYAWKGGTSGGIAGTGAGCVAFAYILSDAAFDNLPARMYANGEFSFSDVKVGDILRVNGDTHTVIVLQVSDTGVVIAEGNYHVNGGNGFIHWERSMAKADVEAADHYITRYPENYIEPDDPSANEPVENGTGTLDGGLTWTLTKAGTLTISGNGTMPDFNPASEQPWYQFKGQTQKIVVEPGVTNIGFCAFQDSKALSVSIPDSVTTISNHAFNGASILSVTIPDSVKVIHDDAFRNCLNLTTVTISDGVETIGERVFYGCQKLDSIVLPSSVVSVGAGTFMDCVELTSAVFASGSKPVTLGDNLFMECWKLAKVTLPENIDCIGNGMFQNCKFALSNLNIPQGVTSLKTSAFASCATLSSITIPDSVTTIESAAFSACTSLRDIYFGGSETQWNSISKTADVTVALKDVTIHYTSAGPDTDPDPGHLHSWASAWSTSSSYHWHECSAENCDITSNSDKDGYGAHVYDDSMDASCNICGYTRTLAPSGHTHSWASAWSNDSDYHWHECPAENCGITSNSDKNGYGAHSYGAWVIDRCATAYQSGSRHRTCTICGYNQTDSIPATGDSSSSGDDSSSDSTTSSTTTRNPDGSTTTTKTDNRTGIVTKTTRNPDGSQIVVETKKDGTTTTRETDQAGNKTETVVQPDGSSTVTVEQKSGTTAAVTTDASGKVEAEVRVSASEIRTAQQNNTAVTLPIPEVHATRNSETAPAITVNTGTKELVMVEIPTTAPTPSTVAVIVRPDGTEEILKTTVPTADGVTVPLPDGATVRIVDNRMNFTDVSSRYWAADAIDFVTARELFAGTTQSTFTPEAPLTRAMLMVVLARFDGEDPSGGTTWYEKGMEWAVAHGISDSSNPNGNITREQLITMLWRYAGSPAASVPLSGFLDASQINAYAQEAMCWAVENGIISGFDGGQLAPQEQASRAQVAQMLRRYIEQ